MNDRSLDHRDHDLGREQVVGLGLEQVAIDDRQVGAEARLEDAQAILGEGREGGAGGEAAEGLLEREPLLGVPAAGGLSLRRLAG